jgi:VWFA-related protein
VKRIQILVIGSAALLAALFTLGQGAQGQGTQNKGSQGQSNQGPVNLNDEIKVASEPYTLMPAGAIRVQSNMVEVGVVVRDSHGKPVPHLTKDDFMLFDSGKQQEISHFSIEQEQVSAPAAALAPQPLPAAPVPVVAPPARYIGFYFDDDNLPTSDLVFARQAAEKFVNTSMDEGDKVAVFTSSSTVTQAFTTDKQKLIAAIAQVTSHLRTASYGSGSCPHIEPYQAWQIAQNWNVHSPAFDLALAEAIRCNCIGNDPGCPPQMANLVQVQAGVVLSMADSFALNTLGVLGDVIRYVGKMPGRRMLIMTSSGYFSMSNSVKKAQDKMVDQALHAGIRINTIDAKGLSADWVGGNPSDGVQYSLGGALDAYRDEVATDERSVSNDSMSFLAEGTGGTFFHNNNDIVGGVRQIAAMPEVSYSLGFSPVELKPDGAYHSLKVRLVNNKGYIIEARPGYYAPNKASLGPQERFEKLNKQVTSSEELRAVAAGVEAKSIALATGEPALRVTVHVDIRNLPFKKESGLHIERLIFITALFDDKNKFLSGVEGVMDMRLTEGTLNMLNGTGASASMTLQAPPGSYRLRQVIQEAVTGRIAAFNTPVEIH